MYQQVLVFCIVALAALFSAWKLMPARRRLQLLSTVDVWSARHPALARWRARWLKPRIARAAGAGCDGCAAHDTRSHTPPR
jgi:hypothetical protein